MSHIKYDPFCDEKEAKRSLQELPFYNICIEKPKSTGLKNIELLQELPFLMN